MTEKAATLDRDTFGVDGAHGLWQPRLAEIGDIKPLAFGQFGEMGPGLEALLASVAKRGDLDEMAGRCRTENREAAAGAQVSHLRRRWEGCGLEGGWQRLCETFSQYAFFEAGALNLH
jgi:hypothetical protein